MRAMTYRGPFRVRPEDKPDPECHCMASIVAEKASPTRVKYMPRRSLVAAAGIIGLLAIGTFAAMRMNPDRD